MNKEDIRQWYEVEKELSNKLRNSNRDERKLIYKSLYNDLFRRVPQHSRLKKNETEEGVKLWIQKQLEIIDGYINRDSVFMEIGPGDCNVALKLAEKVRQVYAVDISDELVKKKKLLPVNFKFIVSDGDSIDVSMESVDVAYSNQFIEHIHPDDIGQHLQNVKKVLKPGGVYIIITPHRFKGPHDVSKYFDQIATGFHLKEWIFSELVSLLHDNGFSKNKIYCVMKGHRIRMPVSCLKRLEYLLGKLPYRPRKIFSTLLFRGIYYTIAVK